jgi:hypothetical protein
MKKLFSLQKHTGEQRPVGNNNFLWGIAVQGKSSLRSRDGSKRNGFFSQTLSTGARGSGNIQENQGFGEGTDVTDAVL